MSVKSKNASDNRRKFLREVYFNNQDGYQEYQVNENWWLVQQWDGMKKEWTVHVYPASSFTNYKKGASKWRTLQDQHLFEIRNQD